MTTLYHGTQNELILHSGICLTRHRSSAEVYGGTVYEIELDTTGLRVDRIYIEGDELRQRIDDQEWPADRDAERLAMIAAGIDAIEYDDVDASGDLHHTIRLLSDRAIAAAAVAV
jgi:hypothetical protein